MKKATFLVPLVLPFVAFAADANSVLTYIINLINSKIIPLIFALALVFFFWGVVMYIIAGGSTEKKQEAKGVMIYGIIGLAVMAAVWGLVNVLTSSFGLSNNAPQLPQAPTY